MTIDAQETLRRIHDSVESGRYLSAWEQARRRWGPSRAGAARPRACSPAAWPRRWARAGSASRCTCAPGAATRTTPRPSTATAARCSARADRSRPSACCAGRPAGRRFAETRADWLALRATVAAGFRDFATAEALLGKQRRCAPAGPRRPSSTRPCSSSRTASRRRSQGVTCRSLAPRRSTGPRVAAAAHLLERLGRGEEALALLEWADAQLESATACRAPSAAAARARAHRRGGGRARRASRRSRRCSRARAAAWLAARRSDAAYLRGDLGAARALAEQAGGGFYREVARRLARAGTRGRPKAAGGALRAAGAPHLLTRFTRLRAAYWSRPVDPQRARARDRLRGHRRAIASASGRARTAGPRASSG